jgi:hypothetical protein
VEHALTKRNLIVAGLAMTALATAACGGARASVKSAVSVPSPVISASTSTPEPTIDPKAQPAVTAYTDFVNAVSGALKNPGNWAQNYPPATDFTNYSFDPFRGQERASIVSLHEQGQLFKGDPGRPRVTVESIETGAKPYPTVVLVDCPTPTPTWRTYDAKTGSDVTPQRPVGAQPMPYLSTIEVIYYQGHWGVSKIDADTSRTCTA